MTSQGADPDLPVSVQESLAETWVSSGLLQRWGHNIAVYARDLLNEVAIIFITSNDSLASGQITEGTQPCPSTELKILLTINLKFKIQFKILVD